MQEVEPTMEHIKRLMGEPFSGRAHHSDERINTSFKARVIRQQYFNRASTIESVVVFEDGDISEAALNQLKGAGFTEPLGVIWTNGTRAVRCRHRADPNRVQERQKEIDKKGRHPLQRAFLNTGEDFDFAFESMTGDGSRLGVNITQAQDRQVTLAIRQQDLELLPDPPPSHPYVGRRARNARKKIAEALGVPEDTREEERIKPKVEPPRVGTSKRGKSRSK